MGEFIVFDFLTLLFVRFDNIKANRIADYASLHFLFCALFLLICIHLAHSTR
jgi:hypothetical protein